MISPHLLKVIESFSTCDSGYNKSTATLAAKQLWADNNTPIFFLDPQKKNPTWCHMVLARGPVLGDDDAEYSELIIIWWSEMTPDTSRVLSIVDWEHHAKNVQL